MAAVLTLVIIGLVLIVGGLLLCYNQYSLRKRFNDNRNRQIIVDAEMDPGTSYGHSAQQQVYIASPSTSAPTYSAPAQDLDQIPLAEVA